MIDVTKLPAYVIVAVAQNLGFDPPDDSFTADQVLDSYLERIKLMSAEEVIEAYLAWNGILGYTRTIINLVHEVEAAELKAQLPDLDITPVLKPFANLDEEQRSVALFLSVDLTMDLSGIDLTLLQEPVIESGGNEGEEIFLKFMSNGGGIDVDLGDRFEQALIKAGLPYRRKTIADDSADQHAGRKFFLNKQFFPALWTPEE